MKTVVYHGYEFQVPAGWPVYRLDEHPTTCVRYDVHAVYLGTPGVNMQCPAGLVGRTQTVSVIPSRHRRRRIRTADHRASANSRTRRAAPNCSGCPPCTAAITPERHPA